jgi:hypothetical protein
LRASDNNTNRGWLKLPQGNQQMTMCVDFWEPCMGAMEAIIAELPAEIQQRIRERLQVVAHAQVKHGEVAASYFSRCLSGEPHPSVMPKPDSCVPPRLTLIEGGAA